MSLGPAARLISTTRPSPASINVVCSNTVFIARPLYRRARNKVTAVQRQLNRQSRHYSFACWSVALASAWKIYAGVSKNSRRCASSQNTRMNTLEPSVSPSTTLVGSVPRAEYRKKGYRRINRGSNVSPPSRCSPRQLLLGWSLTPVMSNLSKSWRFDAPRLEIKVASAVNRARSARGKFYAAFELTSRFVCFVYFVSLHIQKSLHCHGVHRCCGIHPEEIPVNSNQDCWIERKVQST